MSKNEYKRAVNAVHAALKAGYRPPHVKLAKGESGAISIAATSIGIHRNTLRDWIAKGGLCEQHGHKVDWTLWNPPDIEEQPIESRYAVELQEMTRNLLSLQYENIELRRKLSEANKRSLDEEAIQTILGTVSQAKATPPNWTLTPPVGSDYQEVPVTIWSDFHGGETVSFSETNGINEFNVEILERRLRRLVERTIDICRNHSSNNYPGIVINLLGDFVSGGIHPELAKTDEEEVLPTTLRMRDLLIWALDQMIEEFGQVYCPCTAGNHGRQTQKPEFKRYSYKNLDWMIYQLLQRHYAGNERIILDIPDSNEVIYSVYGQRFFACHGDMLGVKGGDGLIGAIGPIMRGAIKVGRQQAAMGRDFDVLLAGHWHQSLTLPKIIINNALKGTDEYAMKQLRAVPTTPSQVLFFMHPIWGRTALRDIYLEDKEVVDNQSWVSILESK